MDEKRLLHDVAEVLAAAARRVTADWPRTSALMAVREAARRAATIKRTLEYVHEDLPQNVQTLDDWEQLAGRTKTDVATLFRRVGRRAREAARRADES